MELFPDDVLEHHIGPHLSSVDLLAVQLTSRYWCSIITRGIESALHVSTGLLRAHNYPFEWLLKVIEQGRSELILWLHEMRFYPPTVDAFVKGLFPKRLGSVLNRANTVTRHARCFLWGLKVHRGPLQERCKWLSLVFCDTPIETIATKYLPWRELGSFVSDKRYRDLILEWGPMLSAEAPLTGFEQEQLWVRLIMTLDCDWVVAAAQAFGLCTIPKVSTLWPLLHGYGARDDLAERKAWEYLTEFLRDVHNRLFSSELEKGRRALKQLIKDRDVDIANALAFNLAKSV